MHVITLAFVTSSLPLHCSNPTYNTLLFLQTSDILLFEEANKLYWNPPIKLYPTPDKPYTRSTPHLTSTTLNVPYTWQCCTCCAKHLANYTHGALHLTNTAVPNLNGKRKRKKGEKTNTCCDLHLTNTALAVPCTWRTLLAVPYTWQTLHSLCPTPDEHYTRICSSTKHAVTAWPFLSTICSWSNCKHWPHAGTNLNDHNPCWLQRLQFTTLPLVVTRTFYYTW